MVSGSIPPNSQQRNIRVDVSLHWIPAMCQSKKKKKFPARLALWQRFQHEGTLEAEREKGSLMVFVSLKGQCQGHARSVPFWWGRGVSKEKGLAGKEGRGRARKRADPLTIHIHQWLLEALSGETDRFLHIYRLDFKKIISYFGTPIAFLQMVLPGNYAKQGFTQVLVLTYMHLFGMQSHLLFT